MTNTSQLLAILLVWSAIGIAGSVATRYWVLRQRVRDRLLDITRVHQRSSSPGVENRVNFLTSWLIVSGFRSARASSVFILLTLLGFVLGGVLIFAISRSGVVDQFVFLLRAIPGGVGEVFLPVAWASPWFGGLLLGFLPTLYVRAMRQKRVRDIEQDLPLTLDLMATLAEAGLSFDFALDRILQAQSETRPLAQDLRLFQGDVLAGRPRIEALRRLMQRIDIPWFSIFVSAVMHAEQVGSSLATTLRTQADDLRMRRRERALAMAMAIPVKLLFPLIVCFLPGIMTAALGPILYQIVQVLDSFLRGSLGR